MVSYVARIKGLDDIYNNKLLTTVPASVFVVLLFHDLLYKK